MAVGAGKPCPRCSTLLQIDARWAQWVCVLFSLLLLAFQLWGRDVVSTPPVIQVGVPALLWMAVIWVIASGPLQRRTHRLPLAQLVLLVVLVLVVVSASILLFSPFGTAMGA